MKHDMPKREGGDDHTRLDVRHARVRAAQRLRARVRAAIKSPFLGPIGR